MALKDAPSKQGYCVQMATNHLSHFLLTRELMPLLETAADRNGEARVVNHSSRARTRAKYNGKYLEKRGGDLGGDKNGFLPLSGPRWERYAQTKLANCLFTYALKEKLQAKESKVKVLVAHPGASATNLTTTTAADGGVSQWLLDCWLSFMAQTGEDGACPLLECIANPQAQAGDFYGPQGGSKGQAVKITPEAFCYDPESMKSLWELSEQATGEFKV
mmetsp:Transcript_26319/g.41174  ORF Transcript_26319/g.41174 Transcript_26319/m.41174 type:complete len:218 (+) Transcript_26319:730-1383(+)